MTGSFEKHRRSICDALQDLVTFALFKEHEKHPWMKNGDKSRKTSHFILVVRDKKFIL